MTALPLTWWDIATSLPTLLIAVWLLRAMHRLRRAGRPLSSERVIQVIIALAVANHIAWAALDKTLPWLRWVTLAAMMVFSYGSLGVRLYRDRRILGLARVDGPRHDGRATQHRQSPPTRG